MEARRNDHSKLNKRLTSFSSNKELGPSESSLIYCIGYNCYNYNYSYSVLLMKNINV